MPDEINNQPRHAGEVVQPQVIAAAMLAMLNESMQAQIALMLQVPVSASDVMNLLIEHTAKLLALVEPRELRETILTEIRRNLPNVVTRHVQQRDTSAGGIVRATAMPVRRN